MRSRRRRSSRSNGRTRAPPFPDQAALYDHIRKAPVRHRKVEKENGNVDDAFRNAARVVEAEYEWPFQSHACMGPGCGVVDVQADKVTVWTGSPKSHFCRDGVANILGVPVDKVEGISMQFAGAYGRNDAGDACMDAAVLSKAVGKPVRVQYMRDEGTGWDPKGPASIHRGRAAIDAGGNVVGYEFYTKGFSRWDVQTNEARPERTLAGHFLGVPLKSEDMFGAPAEAYEYANKRTLWETIPPLLDRASPLRTSHLRDPVGPQLHFASESFIDEMAHAVGADPVQFRLKYLKNERHTAVIKAAAEKSGWVTRTSPRKDQTGDTVSGRGIAYAPRNGTIVAIVAEVEVDRSERQDLGAQVHRRARLRPDHQPDGPRALHRGQHHPGHQPHALGGDAVRPQERDQHRLADLSDPRHHRGAGGRSTSCCSTSPTSRRPAPASRRSGRSRPRSPTRSSTPPACASAACRSRRTA